MGAGWRGSGRLSGSLGDGCRNRMIGVELVVADAGWRRVRTRCAGKVESFGDGYATAYLGVMAAASVRLLAIRLLGRIVASVPVRV